MLTESSEAFQIRRISSLDGIERLAPLAEAEGFGMIKRLFDEWAAGSHTFASPEEPLLVVTAGQNIVAVGGITLQEAGTGRLRRVYVDPAYRRMGVGSMLVEELIQMASIHYRQVVLKTDSERASKFYRALGFSPCEKENPLNATHSLTLV